MEYNAHQRKIIEDMKNRKPTIFQKASMGDKVARHYTEELLGVGDYLESDMDGPKYN